MARSLATARSLLLTLSVVGCSSSAPTPPPATAAKATTSPAKPPEAPVTSAPAKKPKSPRPEAPESEKDALFRLANEPLGFSRDKFDTLRIPLADWKAWRAIRIWGHPTRVTLRYGRKSHAIDTTFYTPSNGPNDPDTCLAKFMEYASTTAQAYSVRLGKEQLVRTTQVLDDGTTKPLVIKLLEGSIDSILMSNDYVAAIAAYQSWPGTCLVRGFAVVSTNHRDLALQVRDRWASEMAPALHWNKKKVKDAPTTEAR